jgi:hypothetical protein
VRIFNPWVVFNRGDIKPWMFKQRCDRNIHGFGSEMEKPQMV